MHLTLRQPHRIDLGFYDSRKNLPKRSSRKRGESNFLTAFEREYYSQSRKHCIAAKEFALPNFGRADLVWIAWNSNLEEITDLAIHQRLKRHKLFAFEAKLNDWQKGLQQAFRYRFFADKAILVMPQRSINPAHAQIDSFKALEVGLWSLKKETGQIEKLFTPNNTKALCQDARENALSLISSKVNLSKFREELKTMAKRI